jgi:hypothetical protein
MTPLPILLFIREEGFYPIEFPADVWAKRTPAEHAEINALNNPGTLRVEDLEGNILWSLQ